MTDIPAPEPRNTPPLDTGSALLPDAYAGPDGPLSAGASWAGLDVLVLSPTPTHPLDAGNRRRIHFVTQALRRMGARVVFVHYPGEADWRARLPAGALAAMVAQYDELFTVPVTRPLHALAADGADHGLDDWWDPAIGDMLAWIFATHRIDVCLVNYTWMSQAFAFCPAGVLKVLDTHDRFSGRRAVLARHGIAPEFFHLGEVAERTGLRRADVVWSIKPQEAVFFRALGIRRVINMPHAEPAWPPRPGSSGGPGQNAGVIRFGIIGARNNVNRVNIETFLDAVTCWVRRTLLPCEIVVAGGVCELLDPDAFPATDAPVDARPVVIDRQAETPGKGAGGVDGWRGMPWIRLLGRVDAVGDFYDAVDVVLAPIAFSTGLKIKVGEALCHGRAVVALAHAFEGFSPRHPFHVLDDVAAMLAACRAIVDDRGLIDELARRSMEVVRDTEAEVARGFADTVAELGATRPGICIVAAARDVFAGSLVLDHLLEAAEYFGRLATVSVFLDDDGHGGADIGFDQTPEENADFVADALCGVGKLLLAPALFASPLGMALRTGAPGTRAATMAELIRGAYFAFWFASAPRPWPASSMPVAARAYLALDALALGVACASASGLAGCVANSFGDVVAVSRRGLGLCLGEASTGGVSLAGAGERRVPLLRRGGRSHTLAALTAALIDGVLKPVTPELGCQVLVLAEAADQPILALTVAVILRASASTVRIVLPAAADPQRLPVGWACEEPACATLSGRVRVAVASRCFMPLPGAAHRTRPWRVVDLTTGSALDGVREVLDRAGVPAITLFASGVRPAHGRWAKAGVGRGLWDSVSMLAATLADDAPDRPEQMPPGYGDDAGWTRIWYEIQDLAARALPGEDGLDPSRPRDAPPLALDAGSSPGAGAARGIAA